MNKAEERFMNYKNSLEGDYVLKDGHIYELAESSKRSVLDTTAFYAKDMGKGVLRGGAKLSEGLLTLIAAGAEKFVLGPEAMKKLDPEGDGIVKDIGEFYKRNIYDNIGETETLAGGLTEGLAQFIVPGVGYYKLFNGLIKARGVMPFITRALAAEGATVGTAQVAGDPNFAGFLMTIFDVNEQDANTLAGRYLEYLRMPENVEDGVTADEVFAEKWKAIQGDIVMGPVGEALGPLLTKFFSGMKKMKKSTVKQIGTTVAGTGAASAVASEIKADEEEQDVVTQE
jgi:hypothetical protein